MRKGYVDMLNRIVLTLVAILLIQSSAHAEAVKQDDLIQTRLLEGQELLFKRDYDGALRIFRGLKDEYPDSPAGCFGEMAVFEVRMLEREDFHLAGELQGAAKDCKRRVDKIMQRYDPTPWNLFISGSLLGLEGFFKARRGEWWDAYVLGNQSRQLFRHVKQIDPNYIDADFGLGMYLYWRSVFIKDLWFLKIFPDRRAEGIAIVESVAENGRFAKGLAKVNLAIAYYEERRYGDAGRILDEYVKRYPNNVILRRIYGKVLVAMKKYDSAIEQFRAILAEDKSFNKSHYFIGAALVLKGDPKGYPGAESELRLFLKAEKGRYWPASGHYWMGRLEEARGNRKLALAEYETAHKLDPKIGDALKRARGLGGGL